MPSRSIPILRARIENANVRWLGIDGKRWTTALQFFNGKDVEITIGPKRKKTSAPQRKYYFSVIVASICEACGYGPDEKEAVHEELKRRFLSVHGNDVLPIVRSTETLTTVEREEYHENCRRWAAEFLGLYVPLPHEVLEPPPV